VPYVGGEAAWDVRVASAFIGYWTGTGWHAGNDYGAGVADVVIEPHDTFAIVRVRNGWGVTGSGGNYLVHLALDGTVLNTGTLTVRRDGALSQARYGVRPADVRLAVGSSPALLDAVAGDVLDTWDMVDETGAPTLPDLRVTTTGDPWRELGDRVVVSEPASGIVGEFRVVSHVLDVGVGMGSSLHLRRVDAGVVYMVLDVDTLDGPTALAL